MEQLGEHFGRGVGVLDQIRAAHIAHSFRLESAQDAVDARELVRLRRKYGDDHPRAREVELRIEQSKEYRAELAVAHRYASTPVAEPGKGWTVDGFVRTADGTPVAGVTVAPGDRAGGWQQEFGYACTDDKGYFRLTADKLLGQETRVYMRAYERESALPSNENRLAPAPGGVDRIEIIVDRGGTGECRAPGGEAPKAPPSSARPSTSAAAAAGAAGVVKPARTPVVQPAATKQKKRKAKAKARRRSK